MKININHCYIMKWWIETKRRLPVWKKNRDIKKNKIKNKDIIPSVQYWWTPQFSIHSLKRISERIENESFRKTYINIQWEAVWCTFRWNWIKPNTMIKVIKDIRKSFNSYIYSTESNTIMTHWELAKYIIAKWWEVITVITDEKIERKYMRKHKYTTMPWHSLKLFLNIW